MNYELFQATYAAHFAQLTLRPIFDTCFSKLWVDARVASTEY